MDKIILALSILALVSCQYKSKEIDVYQQRHDLEMKRHKIIQDSLFYYYDLNAELQIKFWELYSERGNGKKLLDITKKMEANGKKCDALIDKLDMPLKSDTNTFK